MGNKNQDIRDDEFRVIGRPDTPKRDSRKTWGWLCVAVAAIIALLLIVRHCTKEPAEPADVPGIFEQEVIESAPAAPRTFLGAWQDSTGVAYAEKLDTVINDVVLSIYIPHNVTPELSVGAPDAETRKAIMAFQAADIRADNRKILGAFVLKGEPLAWGLSKRGYCGIIDGKITVGVADDSPLFEKATETGGYFFRQYPLVDNGVLVENEPKNKTMRKALCDRAGQIMVVVSETDESFHDFAQALVDLGVDKAIYLVGSHTSFGWYVDKDGVKTEFGADKHYAKYKNENYVVWRAGKPSKSVPAFLE